MKLYKIQNQCKTRVDFVLLLSVSPGKRCSVAEVPFARPQWKA